MKILIQNHILIQGKSHQPLVGQLNLIQDKAEILNLDSDKAEISNLDRDMAEILNLVSGKAEILDLDAVTHSLWDFKMS